MRVHLVPRQLLRRVKRRDLIDDPRTWVWGCGGPMGNGGHHGQMDQARSLRFPRWAVSPELEALMVELGLDWWLDREYGPRRDALLEDEVA